MIALFDLDSLVYKARYKIEEIPEVISLSENLSELEYNDLLIDCSIHRLENLYMKIINEIEDSLSFEIDSWEFYLTICTKPYRKKLAESYKKDRIKDPIVNAVRQKFYEQTDECFISPEWEADDLIASRIKGMDKLEYIIISADKDVLKGLEGYNFDFYVNPNDENRNYRGFNETTKEQANKFLFLQMLMGDKCDGINGIKGIGIKKAEKILEGKNKPYEMFRKVAEIYLEKSTKNEFRINRELLTLGVR